MIDTILLIINAIACGLIALRLLAFNKQGAGHNRLMSWLAYIIIIATASVPIRTAFGDYPLHDASETILNVVLCIGFLVSRGNVAEFFRRDRQ